MVGKRADRSWIKSKIVAPAYPPYLASAGLEMMSLLIWFSQVGWVKRLFVLPLAKILMGCWDEKNGVQAGG